MLKYSLTEVLAWLYTHSLVSIHLTITAIFFYFDHQEGVFQGLIPILNCYLENMEVDVDTRCTILNYLKLIKKRASGKFASEFMFSSAKSRFSVYAASTQSITLSILLI